VGRLEPVKAYERMIEALVHIRGSGELSRPVYLVICGEGSQRPALEDYARRRGVAEYARFPGWVDRPAEMYRMLDVFALTSLSEGASVSLMEAMACGAAPVVMTVGGNADILGAELRDQAVPAGDVAAFRRAVVATLRSPDRLERVRRIASERAAERYGLDRLIGAYERAYRDGGLSDRGRDVSPAHAERPVGDGQVEGGDDRTRPVLAQ
jgi:glycosyltransferase involved in cell wall biosynthesis